MHLEVAVMPAVGGGEVHAGIQSYLVDKFSVDASDGVASVPVQLLGAGRLILPQPLPQALHVLQAAHLIQGAARGGAREAGARQQVGSGGAPGQQVAAGALTDQTVQVGAAGCARPATTPRPMKHR